MRFVLVFTHTRATCIKKLCRLLIELCLSMFTLGKKKVQANLFPVLLLELIGTQRQVDVYSKSDGQKDR